MEPGCASSARAEPSSETPQTEAKRDRARDDAPADGAARYGDTPVAVHIYEVRPQAARSTKRPETYL